jgi:hypothetical protein
MLATVHKILIGSGLALGVGFVGYSIHHESYGAAAGTGAFVAVLGAYFVWFSRKNRR